MRELSELYLSAGQYRLAADALIKLARVATDEEVLRKAFFELGAIYSEQLPDPRRAEIAYARAARLDPSDRVPVERLLALYLREQAHDKALRACERLIDLATSEAEIDRFTIQLASILETTGDPRRAERALNVRREQTPTVAGDPDRALRPLRDARAISPRSRCTSIAPLHALRAAVERAPDDAARFAALSELLARRGRPHAAACVAAVAEDLGLADAQLVQRAAQHVALGNAALQPALFARVAPAELTDSVRALARFLDARGAELFGLDAERISSPAPALAAALDYTRSAFGLRELALLAIPGRRVRPAARRPAHARRRPRPDRALRQRPAGVPAACARRAPARAGLLGVLRCNPRELGLLLAVMREPDEVAALKGKSSAAQAMRDRAQALGAKRFAELQALVAQRAAQRRPAARARASSTARASRSAYGAAYGPAFAALAASAPAPCPGRIRPAARRPRARGGGARRAALRPLRHLSRSLRPASARIQDRHMAEQNPRIGLIGPAQRADPALARAFELLLGDTAVRQVIYLGADDAPHALVAEWTRAGIGEQEFLRNGVELACEGTPDQISALLSEEREVSRLQRIRVLPPPPARAIEMMDRFLVLAVYDKAVLDEDDIANAQVIVYGRAEEPGVEALRPALLLHARAARARPRRLSRAACKKASWRSGCSISTAAVRMREPLLAAGGKFVVTP